MPIDTALRCSKGAGNSQGLIQEPMYITYSLEAPFTLDGAGSADQTTIDCIFNADCTK